MSGNPAESREQGKDSATDAGSGVEETGRAISFQERAGKPGGGKGILIQNEHTGALSTLNNQPVCYGFEPGAAQRLNVENRFVEETAPTLRADMGDNQTSVVYGMSAYDSNSMKSSNPHSGIYKAETARTLDLNGGSPACNQGGMMVLEGNGSRPSHKGDGYAESEISYTLNAVENHGVCIPISTYNALKGQGRDKEGSCIGRA